MDMNMYDTYYKRRADGTPIFWGIAKTHNNDIVVVYGVVGKAGRREQYSCKDASVEYKSKVNAKRKEGYKKLQDLYDNAPTKLEGESLITYLNNYLPKYNTDGTGKVLCSLCKTLDDDKPFKREEYVGSWKIDGERCNIFMKAQQSLFKPLKLYYFSREGTDWTEKLSFMDDILLPKINNNIKELMLDYNCFLDGELYIPGYGLNEINSIIKNTAHPAHKNIQFWMYDLGVDNMPFTNRLQTMYSNFNDIVLPFKFSKEEHYNNSNQFVVLPHFGCDNYSQTQQLMTDFVINGFEGIVIRSLTAEYNFGGRRNNAMLKCKPKYDGLFTVLDIVPEGEKRKDLAKVICVNDCNNEQFEVTLKMSHDEQRAILMNKGKYTGKRLLVQYCTRGGVKDVPMHAKGIKFKA